MEFLETLYNEVVGFLGIRALWELLSSGNYEALKTYEGVLSLIYPIIPLLILLEFSLGMIYKATD